MRTRMLYAVACTVILLGIVHQVSAASPEDFSQGSAGWMAYTLQPGDRLEASPAVYRVKGGHPGGCVAAQVLSGGPRLYAIQPSSGPEAPFGDLTGKILSADVCMEGMIAASSRNVKVRFFIGYVDPNGREHYWVSGDGNSWPPDAAVGWKTLHAPLDENAFVPWQRHRGGGISFAEVLRRYNDIGLILAGDVDDPRDRGISGNGALLVDNFGVLKGEGGKAETPAKAAGKVKKRVGAKPGKPPGRPARPAPGPPEGPFMPGGSGDMTGMALMAFMQYGSALMVASLGLWLLMYLIFAFFLYLIAVKLSVPRAWIAWIPVVNVYTMVAAAKKPWWWLVLLLLPLFSWVPLLGLVFMFIGLVDLVLIVLIWMAISSRLGMNKWLGLLILVPVIQWGLWGFLALKKDDSLPKAPVVRILLITALVFVVLMAGLWGLLTYLVFPNLLGPMGGIGPSPIVMGGEGPDMEETKIEALTEAEYKALLNKAGAPVPSGKKAGAAGPALVYPDTFWADDTDPHLWVKVRLPDIPNLDLFKAGRVQVTAVRTRGGGNAYDSGSGLETEFFHKVDLQRMSGPPPFLEALRDVHLTQGTAKDDLEALEGVVGILLPVSLKTRMLKAGDRGKRVSIHATDVTLKKLGKNTAELKIEKNLDRFITVLAYLGDQPVHISGYSSSTGADTMEIAYQFGDKADRVKVVVAEKIVDREYPFSMSFQGASLNSF